MTLNQRSRVGSILHLEGAGRPPVRARVPRRPRPAPRRPARRSGAWSRPRTPWSRPAMGPTTPPTRRC